MTVTALDIWSQVQWTAHGHTHTGRLERLPKPGTPGWWITHGKATVRLADGYAHVRPDELVVVEEAERVAT